MTVSMLQPSDVCTDSSVIQPVSIANTAGSSTTVAAADHVHAAGASSYEPAYQVISETFSATTVSGYTYTFIISLPAASGTSIVGGGFALSVSITDTHLEAVTVTKSAPASDGSSWNFIGQVVLTNAAPTVTLYAICMAV